MIKKNFKLKMLIDKWPYFLLIVPITAVTYLQQMRVPGWGLGESVLTWLWSFTFYLKKFLFPHPLQLIYTLPHPVTIFHEEYLLAVVIAAFCLYGIYRWKNSRFFIFAFLIYFFSIFFLFRFDDFKDVHVVGDRFMYLPSFGFCMLLGLGVERLWERFKDHERAKKVYLILIVLFFVLLSIKTYSQTQIWKDSKSVWENILLYKKGDDSVYGNLGEAYLRENNFAQAKVYFEKSLEYKGDHVLAYINLGVIEKRQGNLPAAIQYFEKAKAINPQQPAADYNLGNVYLTMNEMEKAEEHFLAVLTLKPQSLAPRYKLVELSLKKKDYARAKRILGEIVTIEPKQSQNKSFRQLSERLGQK